MDRGELEGLDRESLVVRAQAAGIRRARILTRPELIDELLRLDPSADDAQLRKSRGFFGRARDLVARVVERGLHLPDAAERIREIAGGNLTLTVPRTEPQAMPTVTLAEIYAAQGHRGRAVETLRRVLEREPDHAAARALLGRLEDEGYAAPPPPPLPPEIELDLSGDDEDDDALDDADASARAPSGDGAAATVSAAASSSFAHAGQPDGTAETAEAEEIDECFAIPVSPEGDGKGEPGSGAMYVRWSVSFSTIGALLGAMPNGRFVVRAHIVTPSWDGPGAEVRDLTVDPDAGEAMLRALPRPAVVRVAVGWFDGSTFVPLAHSPALETSRTRGLVIWTTKGTVPVVLDDPRAAPIARAFEASRSATSSARAHG